MFDNLDAEQKRMHKTNTDMANELKMSRVSYENKKKSGKFNVKEAQFLCNYFGCSFEYLFAISDFVISK